MKGLQYDIAAGTFEICEIPLPVPKSDEIRVKCYATALNPVDAKVGQWKGMLSSDISKITLGLDVCGIVDAIGSDVKTFNIGDTVLYHGRMFQPNGGFAEYAIHDALTCVVLSREGDACPLDPVTLAATPCAAWTAHRVLYDKLHIPPIVSQSYGINDASHHHTKSLCIVGASGGVGSFALQFAKLSGMKTVIAVCSTRNVDHVRSLGATHVIDYTSEGIVEGINRVTNNEGVDLIVDCVGAETTKEAVQCLKYDGMVCPVVSFAEGDIDSFLKSHVWCQVSLGAAHINGIEPRKRLQKCGRFVTNLVLQHKLQVPVTKIITLEEVAGTLEEMLKANNTGKIVCKF